MKTISVIHLFLKCSFISRFGCCACLGNTCIGKSWSGTRQFVFNVVDNPFFEWTILLLIFASSLSLCFEDINLQDNEELMFILKIVNLVFAVLFFCEMILKWIAFGLWRYFTSAWTCLDFIIVCVSLFICMHRILKTILDRKSYSHNVY